MKSTIDETLCKKLKLENLLPQEPQELHNLTFNHTSSSFNKEKSPGHNDIEFIDVKSNEKLFIPLDHYQRGKLCKQLGLKMKKKLSYNKEHCVLDGPPSKVQEVQGDGNCLFRSIAFLLSGDEECHKIIRQHCIEYIADNGREIERYLGQPGSDYISNSHMNCDYVWGTDNEIIACAQLLKHDIVVYHRWGIYGQKWLTYPSMENLTSKGGQSLFLDNHSGKHFNPVLGV